VVRGFEAQSETRVHSSPPSLAALRAAENALVLNRAHGERVRLYLSRLVERFRAGMRQIGLTVEGGLFPVQMLNPIDGIGAATLHLRLDGLGIRTVLVRCCRDIRMRLAFLITALHRPADIDRAIDALASATMPVRTARPTVRAS
jgi:8-amino-7-oxononanoate synthase